LISILENSDDHFRSLIQNEYLSTDHVDGYLNYVRTITNGIDFQNVLVFSKTQELSDVRKQLMKDMKICFFPIIRDRHFRLAVAVKKSKEIHYYDPLGSAPPMDVRESLRTVFTDYTFINCSQPHQTDGVNCGMFILYYCAHYIFKKGRQSIQKDMLCTSKNMYGLRKRMAKKFHPLLFSEHFQTQLEQEAVFQPLAKKNCKKVKPRKLIMEEKMDPHLSSIDFSFLEGITDDEELSNIKLSLSNYEEEFKILDPNGAILTESMKELLVFSSFHLEKKETQKEAYLKPLAPGWGRILIDFKSNLKIGMSAEQVSQQYYKQSHRQLLGIMVQYPDSENQIFFDIVSEDLTKDNVFVTVALQTVFEMEQFRDLKLNNLEVWSDGAKHFRNG